MSSKETLQDWIHVQGERSGLPAGIASFILFLATLNHPLVATGFLVLATLTLSASFFRLPRSPISLVWQAIPIIFWFVLTGVAILTFFL